MKHELTAKRIQKALISANISAQELSNRCGVAKASISQYVNGSHKPSNISSGKMAPILDVNPLWLMGFDVPMKRMDEDPNISMRDAELEDIEKILAIDGYSLCCDTYDDDFFVIKTASGQTVASFYDYELISHYKTLSKNGNVTAQQLISFDIASGKYNDVTLTEYDLIKMYRSLDPTGQKHVETVLHWENDRAKQLQDKDTRITELESALYNSNTTLRIYTYMRKIAAAGTGFYFDDIPTDTIEAPYLENADFIIGVSGDSMEPTYHDGDLVYVEKCQGVNIGDIGIFMVNGECFIKEAGEDSLISHNAVYDPIPGTEHIACFGKVLGKVTLG